MNIVGFDLSSIVRQNCSLNKTLVGNQICIKSRISVIRLIVLVEWVLSDR